MLQFAQPLFSLLIGLALAIYGIIHSATRLPSSQAMALFWSSLPAMLSVFIFLLGVIAVILGFVLLYRGIQGLRRRYHQIHRAYGRYAEPTDEMNEDGYGGQQGYGYR